MVKADAKRNYYADLELTPAADTEEIKRQFRKLARLYHPDRNPGKEVEYVPKFQAIQAAHEILTDPDQRAKYDNDRRRYGTAGGQPSRPPPPPRQAQTGYAAAAGRSPYEAYSNFPPPRMRTNAGANAQRERPQSYAAPPRPPPPQPQPQAGMYGAGARGPPPRPPPRAHQYAQDDTDANQRKNVFTAWERMRHANETAGGWSDDDGLRKARAANDSAKAHQSKPGLGRSHTTRVPNSAQGRRAGGFDPNARLSGDSSWEPAARSTSAYQSTPRQGPPRAPSPPPPTAHGEKPKMRPDPLSGFRASKLSADEVPFMENQRVRTPYGGEGIGQKHYFNMEDLSRSSSVRDVPNLAKQTGGKNSPRANAGRPRSASPMGRGSANAQETRRASVKPGTKFDVGYSSSSSDDAEPSSPMSASSTTPMSGPPGGDAKKERRKAPLGSAWSTRRADTPLKEQTNGTQEQGADSDAATAGGSIAGGNGLPKYETPSSTSHTPLFTSTLYSAQTTGDATPMPRHMPPRESVRANRKKYPNAQSKIPMSSTRGAAKPSDLTPPTGKDPLFISLASAAPSTSTPLTAEALARNDAAEAQAQAQANAASKFPQYMYTPEQLANHKPPAHRFSFSNVAEPGSAASAQRTNSADNVNTTFHEKAWDGTFQGSTFAPTQQPGRASGMGTRRGSPPRKPRRPTAGNRAGTSTDNPIDLTGASASASERGSDVPAGFRVPPPPPMPANGFPNLSPNPPGSAGNPPTSAGSSQGGVPLPNFPAGGGFQGDAWLGKQTFFFDPPAAGQARPPSPGKQGPGTVRKGKAGAAGRPRKQSKSENVFNGSGSKTDEGEAEGEESETPLHKSKTAPAQMDGDGDGDAMDIDPEPTLSGNINTNTNANASKSASPRATREPRMVNVPPTRSDWRENAPGAIPNVNGTIPPGTIPSAVPNAAVPPPPPPPPPPNANVNANTKTKRDVPQPSISTLNFDSFRAAAPFASSIGTNGGLSGMKSDFDSSLPFPSAASASPSAHTQQDGQGESQLQLHLPPLAKAPSPPLVGNRGVISQTQWRKYMADMAFYMGAYHGFESAILRHFNARHASAAKFGTGASPLLSPGLTSPSLDRDKRTQTAMGYLEALSDGSGDGYASYLRGMQEDVRVQKCWDVARERHRDCVEKLLDFKKRISGGEVRIVPG